MGQHTLKVRYNDSVTKLTVTWTGGYVVGQGDHFTPPECTDRQVDEVCDEDGNDITDVALAIISTESLTDDRAVNLTRQADFVILGGKVVDNED